MSDYRLTRPHAFCLAVSFFLALAVPMRAQNPPYAEWPDDHWAEIARRVPGFAGWWLDGGTIVLMLVDPTQRDAALEAIAAELPQRYVRNIRVHKAEFDFRQLREWKSLATGDSAVNSSDADEVRNRIVVGIADSSPSALAGTRRRLIALGIPSQALIVEGGSIPCMRPGMAAVVVQIRTEDGSPAAAGARVILDGRDTAWSEPTRDAVAIDVGGNHSSGHVSVRVEKPWYHPVVLPNVAVKVDACGIVATTIVQARLALLPAAPAIRSLYVGPRGLLSYGSSTSQLRAVLDAVPGVSDSVTWSSSDTAVAVVDGRGVMKTRCRRNYREAFMRATLIADTAIRDSVLIGVGAATRGVAGC